MNNHSGTVVGMDDLGYISFHTFLDSLCCVGQNGREGFVCDHMKESLLPKFRTGTRDNLHDKDQDTRVHIAILACILQSKGGVGSFWDTKHAFDACMAGQRLL